METLGLKKSELLPGRKIMIGGSKSISNRLLILKQRFPNLVLANCSDAEDTQLLISALGGDSQRVDVHHAGTAFRFLCSYFAILPDKEVVLTGSERLLQRPIKDLVDALVSMGATIEYLGETGFPPLKIKGKNLSANSVKIKANVSSQFISSLLLMGSFLPNGLQIELQGKPTSKPYLEMTIALMQDLGIIVEQKDNLLWVHPCNDLEVCRNFVVESDWSSASYFYALAAIGRKEIQLSNFYKNSLQGDKKLVEIFKNFFGVETYFHPNDAMISLKPIQNFESPKSLDLDLNDVPDISLTLCVVAAIFKIKFHFTGLHTLKVKETDRLLALHKELKKIGCITQISDDSISVIDFSPPQSAISIATYQDHRMAMSFAPYCLVRDLEIQDPMVVEKSYPNFWKDLESILVII